jgi:hypothetical protein
MAKYKFKYWYEWGERDCFLWADDDATKAAFGTDVSYLEMDKLPLSDALKQFLVETARLHDCSLNWEYPPDPPDPEDWTPEMAAEFDRRAHEGYDRICAELGDDYEIEYAV